MKKVAIILFLGLCLSPVTRATLQFAGNVTSTTVAADKVDFVLQQGAIARVEMLAADLVRVRISPNGQFSSNGSDAVVAGGFTSPGAAIFDTAGATYLVTAQMVVVVLKTPFRVILFRADGSLLLADMDSGTGWDTASGLVFNRKFAPTDEHYFGLGDRGGPIDRRGRSFFMQNVDWAGYDEFRDPLYISIPFYYGLRSGNAYGLFLDNPALPFFDMDSQSSGVVTFGALKGELDYYVFSGPEPWRIAQTYGKLTGFTPLPPKWTLGFHQSRYGYKSQAEFQSLADTFRQLRIPCDALYFDIDYMDRLRAFSWDPANFPSPIPMNASLETKGFKRVNIIEPLVRNDDPLWPFLSGSGMFLKDSAGNPVVNSIWYGDVSWMDFTKDSARNWFKDVLKVFLSMGITATWNDLNEPAENFMPGALYDFNGSPRTDLQARNVYALKESQLINQAQKELRPNVRPWSISRSGYSGIQRYSANWSGDTLTSFDSLRVSVQISLSMGLSGQNHFGHDIGGFLGSPSPELYIRWLEFSSFTPLFRSHAMNTSAPREPWAFGEPYTTIARNVINQRYQLLPYLYSVFEAASKSGQPVVSPVFFYFPADPQTYSQDREFMLGQSMLVAPVVDQGATTRSLYLPGGVDWVDWHTDAVYTGGQQIMVSAPLEQIPVFVKAGSILPGGPVLQYVTENVPPQVTADVFPGPNSTFTMYEDDGQSFDFTGGVFLRTQLSKTQYAAGDLVTIQRVEGTWTPQARSWKLAFHNYPAPPASVELNGTTLPLSSTESALDSAAQGWYYRASDHRLLVRIQDSQVTTNLFVRR